MVIACSCCYDASTSLYVATGKSSSCWGLKARLVSTSARKIVIQNKLWVCTSHVYHPSVPQENERPCRMLPPTPLLVHMRVCILLAGSALYRYIQFCAQ